MTDDQRAALEQLRAPFDGESIGKLPRVTCKECRDSRERHCAKHQKERCGTCHGYLTSAHTHIDYVGHAHVTQRLLDVDPTWTWEPAAVDERGAPVLERDGSGRPMGLWIRLTVAGVTRLGYGSTDVGSQADPVKVLIGDALRNAALRFGVALDLWKREDNATQAERAVPADAPAKPKTLKEIRELALEVDVPLERIAAHYGQDTIDRLTHPQSLEALKHLRTKRKAVEAPGRSAAVPRDGAPPAGMAAPAESASQPGPSTPPEPEPEPEPPAPVSPAVAQLVARIDQAARGQFPDDGARARYLTSVARRRGVASGRLEELAENVLSTIAATLEREAGAETKAAS